MWKKNLIFTIEEHFYLLLLRRSPSILQFCFLCPRKLNPLPVWKPPLNIPLLNKFFEATVLWGWKTCPFLNYSIVIHLVWISFLKESTFWVSHLNIKCLSQFSAWFFLWYLKCMAKMDFSIIFCIKFLSLLKSRIIYPAT